MEKIRERDKREFDRIDKVELWISYTLKAFIFGLLITSIIKAEYFLVFSGALVLFLMFLPSIIDRNYKINFPVELDFVLTVILWLHFVLGEVNQFYHSFWWWDVFLHYFSSMLIGLFGFILAYAFFRSSKIDAKPWFIIVFSISLAIALGTIWEIFEFGMDQLFGFNMQKSGLIDTMWDLIIDALGAIIFAFSGYIYVKAKKPRGFIHRVIQKTLEINKIK